jgi:hypothetical protein
VLFSLFSRYRVLVAASLAARQGVFIESLFVASFCLAEQQPLKHFFVLANGPMSSKKVNKISTAVRSYVNIRQDFISAAELEPRTIFLAQGFVVKCQLCCIAAEVSVRGIIPNSTGSEATS